MRYVIQGKVNYHIVASGDDSMGAKFHEGDEADYVFKDRVELFVDCATLNLSIGDLFSFASYLFHNCRNLGKYVNPMLGINKPPTF